MTNPSNSAVQNLLPVQAYFNLDGSFNTFIGQGLPFYATTNPVQSGLTITNSTLDSSPIGSTSPSTGVFTNIATTTGTISTQPSSANDIVNLLALQSYAAGISWKQPCAVATLTNITLSGLQTIDTYTTLAGDRVLVKNQSTAANNGIYIASATAWTRSTDADAWQEFVSAVTFIEYGSQSGGAFFCTATPGGTLGVTAINWSPFTISAVYSAGTGLTLAGTVFSITPVGTANTYGSATQTPVFTTNASGQVTAVTNTTITPAIGSITGLGTSVATALGVNVGTAGSFVVNGGVLGTPSSGNLANCTFPTLNQNTTGYAASLAGGASGSIPYQTAVNTTTFLPIGSNGQVLTLTAGLPSWVTPTNGTVTSVTATSPVVSSGGNTPVISMPAATSSVNGYLTSTDWTTFNNKANAFTYTTNYVPYGQGTTTPAQSANLQFNGTTLTVANDALISGLTIGKGGGAITTNTAIGLNALVSNTTGAENTAVGQNALYTNNGTANSAFGRLAMYSNTSGSSNTGLGYNALYTNATASYNTAIGYQAGYNTTGGTSTFVGAVAGYSNTTGTNNNAFGELSLYANTTGGSNVAIGTQALRLNTTASNNTAVGYQSLYNQSTGGAENTAVGYQAGYSNTGQTLCAVGSGAAYSNTTGADNTAIGSYRPLYSNTTGSYNVAIGRQALLSNTTASDNVAIGYQAAYTANGAGTYLTAVGSTALKLNTTGVRNTAVGFQSQLNNTTGSYNSSFGLQSLSANTTGSNNTALGEEALVSNTTASNNTAVGYQAGYSNTTGNSNVAVGQASLYSNTTGSQHTAIGVTALQYNTTGSANTAVGNGALSSNSTGNSNTAVGSARGGFHGGCLQLITTGYQNTAVGAGAGFGNDTGTDNVYVGYLAGYGSGSANANANNTAVGSQSLRQVSTGGNNVAIGQSSLYFNTTASYNTAVGYNAGYSNATGAGNVYFGRGAGYNATNNNLTFVGQNAGYNSTGSDNTFIGQSSGFSMTTGSKNTILGGYNGNQGGLDIRTSSNYIVLSDGDGNPRQTIDGSGNICFVATAFNASLNSNFFLFGAGNGTQYIGHVSGTSSGVAYQDFRYNGTQIGSITQSGTTAVLYNVTSDQRLKENIVDAPQGNIDQIKVRSFDWKADGSHQEYGMVAQELLEVAPYAVHQPVDTNEMMAVDYSKLVPMMIKEIQDLKQRIATLENK